MKINASCELDKQQSILEHLNLPSDDGLIQDKLNFKDCHLDKGSLISPIIKKKVVLKKKLVQENPSYTQESQVTNKKTTCDDKKNILKIKSKIQKKNIYTFKISHPDSISKDLVLSEFWTSSKKEKYKVENIKSGKIFEIKTIYKTPWESRVCISFGNKEEQYQVYPIPEDLMQASCGEKYRKQGSKIVKIE